MGYYTHYMILDILIYYLLSHRIHQIPESPNKLWGLPLAVQVGGPAKRPPSECSQHSPTRRRNLIRCLIDSLSIVHKQSQSPGRKSSPQCAGMFTIVTVVVSLNPGVAGLDDCQSSSGTYGKVIESVTSCRRVGGWVTHR